MIAGHRMRSDKPIQLQLVRERDDARLGAADVGDEPSVAHAWRDAAEHIERGIDGDGDHHELRTLDAGEGGFEPLGE